LAERARRVEQVLAALGIAVEAETVIDQPEMVPA
jgi:hypothetical protein